MNDPAAELEALRRVNERLSQRLREIERERRLPTLRKEVAAALGVNLSTVSRWYAAGLARGATPEEAARWRSEKCNTLQHYQGRKKRSKRGKVST